VNKKHIFPVLIIFVLIVFCTSAIYATKFRIHNNENEVKIGIEELLNKSSSLTSKIEIKKLIDIDNKKLVLYTFNSQLGDAELKKGLNNKYKVEFVKYGTNLFQNEVTQTNKGQYLWVMGKNYNREIYRIVLKLDGRDYIFNIPGKEDYFVEYTKVLAVTESKFPSEARLYDIKENDITDKVYQENKI